MKTLWCARPRRPQRVVCGDGGVADPCTALGDCAHLSKGVEHANAHLQRRCMDVLFLKYSTHGYDSARDAVRSGRVGGVTGLATNIGAAHVVVSAALGLCTDAYTTCCWEQLSQTEQKRPAWYGWRRLKVASVTPF